MKRQRHTGVPTPSLVANNKIQPLLTFVSLLLFGIVAAQPCWAHDTKALEPDGSTDTCGSVRASAEQSIHELKALSAGPQDLASASNLEIFIERLMGKTVADPAQAGKIAELRRDIQRYEATLRSRGCDTQEIDKEIPSEG